MDSLVLILGLGVAIPVAGFLGHRLGASTAREHLRHAHARWAAETVRRDQAEMTEAVTATLNAHDAIVLARFNPAGAALQSHVDILLMHFRAAATRLSIVGDADTAETAQALIAMHESFCPREDLDRGRRQLVLEARRAGTAPSPAPDERRRAAAA